MTSGRDNEDLISEGQDDVVSDTIDVTIVLRAGGDQVVEDILSGEALITDASVMAMCGVHLCGISWQVGRDGPDHIFMPDLISDVNSKSSVT